MLLGKQARPATWRPGRDAGATGVEYGILVALIAMVIATAASVVGLGLGGAIASVVTGMPAASARQGPSALQRSILSALGVSEDASPVDQMNACNSAASRAGSAGMGGSTKTVSFNQACVSSLARSMYATPESFMSAFNLSTTARSGTLNTQCQAAGATGNAASGCAETAYQVWSRIPGNLPASSVPATSMSEYWGSDRNGGPPASSFETNFRNWVDSQSR